MVVCSFLKKKKKKVKEEILKKEVGGKLQEVLQRKHGKNFGKS